MSIAQAKKNIASRPANIKGWPEAIFLDNGLIEILVSPEASRVMQYSLGGQKFFFNDEKLFGKTSVDVNSDEWLNFGGARSDIAPQSAWKRSRWQKDWPPPPVLSAPKVVKVNDGSVSLSPSPYIENDLPALSSIDISLVENSSIVSVNQKLDFQKESSEQLANWFVCQLYVEQKNEIYVHSPASKEFQKGFIQLMDVSSVCEEEKNNLDSDVKIFSGGNCEWKIGSQGNWLALRPSKDSDKLFCVFTKDREEEKYPDGDCSCEIYSSKKQDYVELELLGPLSAENRSDEFFFAACSCSGKPVFVNKFGACVENLTLRNGFLKGTYGVFYDSRVKIIGVKEHGVEEIVYTFDASPIRQLKLSGVKISEVFEKIRIDVFNMSNKLLGTLDNYDANANNL